MNNEIIEPFLEKINAKLEGLSRDELIKRFVSEEFNRFVSYYKNARDINIGSKDFKGKEPKRNRRNQNKGRRGNFSRFHINLGSKNNLTTCAHFDSSN